MTPHLWKLAVGTDIGTRDEQQDAFDTFDTAIGKILVVCDGVGGHSGGKQASQAGIEALKNTGTKLTQTTAPGEALETLARSAHLAVQEVRADPEQSSASATLALALVTSSHVHLGTMGDSRIYWLERNGTLDHTRDDTVAQMLVDRGQLSPDEVRHHPDRNRLTKSLGNRDFGGLETKNLPLDQLNGLLLASDGFWEHTGDDQLKTLLRTQPPAQNQTLKNAIHEAVREAGEKADNTTALLLTRTSPQDRPNRAAPKKTPTPPRRENQMVKGFLISLNIGIILYILYKIIS